PYLYSDALALVMPTYFGPTNIPPMEALALGVPVLYSDLPSFREQLGEAARYIDLERPESLADALDDLLTGAGGRPAGSSVGSDDIAAYAHVLAQILSAYRRKVGPPRNGDDA
ncbi:MAG TPA: glycosyltransferase, partial [Woeseiaceae bacterium]